MYLLVFICGLRDCACPPSQKNLCSANETCSYLNELDHAASRLGLLPPEQMRGRGGQLLKHTVLIIVYSLSMFIVSTIAIINIVWYICDCECCLDARTLTNGEEKPRDKISGGGLQRLTSNLISVKKNDDNFPKIVINICL